MVLRSSQILLLIRLSFLLIFRILMEEENPLDSSLYTMVCFKILLTNLTKWIQQKKKKSAATAKAESEHIRPWKISKGSYKIHAKKTCQLVNTQNIVKNRWSTTHTNPINDAFTLSISHCRWREKSLFFFLFFSFFALRKCNHAIWYWFG